MAEGDFLTSAPLVQALEQLHQTAETCAQLLALAPEHLELPSHGLELLHLVAGLALPPLRGGKALPPPPHPIPPPAELLLQRLVLGRELAHPLRGLPHPLFEKLEAVFHSRSHSPRMSHPAAPRFRQPP